MDGLSSAELFKSIAGIGGIVVVLIFFGFLAFLVKCWNRIPQGRAMVRTGMGKPRVGFSGMFVFPIIHMKEVMDISVKRVEITRMGAAGLVCQDNLRADIKVAFFVGVNATQEDVLKVAQALGVTKGSTPEAVSEFFDAKFSEALKSVGKRFDFVELYTSREKFKKEILQVIGTDLNGYVLDDAAIDYLEQTEVDKLDPRNILDAEGIKKITELTAAQNMLSNDIRNNEEKTITRQNVETREAILEMERQLAATEEKKNREVASVKAREEAETKRIQEEERLKGERARITTEEEIAIATENKDRQIIVALKSKERTEAVETERVEKDRMLEATERERTVALADIAKEKAIEEEKKNIQFIIKERVVVEKAVVVEEEKIKDTRDWAEAERIKRVAVIDAERQAEEKMIKDVQAAEADQKSAERKAKQQVILAEAEKESAELKRMSLLSLAEGHTAEAAVSGMAEVRIMEARANAIEKEGLAVAKVTETKGLAEAVVTEKKGAAEAFAMGQKYHAEAEGITEKAEAMKIFDLAGKDHEEFKLNLDKALKVELAGIDMQRELAMSQARVLQEGLKTARIDIVGGETTFFERIAGAITNGKAVDRTVSNSQVLSDVKETFFNGDPEYFKGKLQEFVDLFAISSDDVKNLSLSALLMKMGKMATDDTTRSQLAAITSTVDRLGVGNKKSANFLS